jgi:Rv0078B-related antitoxin
MAKTPLPHFEMIDDETDAWLRGTTPAQRIQMVNALNKMGREILGDEIRRRWPDWDDAAVAKEVARRLLADENLPNLYARDLRKSGRYDLASGVLKDRERAG